ncbi:probable receptor-like protein kinase At1g80640 [Phragmites australis]|uniref:probable receptor-like protein kinase At1g80640 n=1 Tax=Phragmites australis TaxID=29695 RepID=UPI002D768396|nr:probable receptor-like protein kinase At1g80640 [Phragmites australis]
MRLAPRPLPFLCSSILALLLLASCSSSANGKVAPSSAGASPAAKHIHAAAAGGANGTGSFAPAVPAPPPIVIIEERHHHFHRELVIASVLASIAIVAIILSTLYAWILWRRSRRLPDGKGARSSDTTGGIMLVPILSKFKSLKTSGKALVAMIEYPSLEAATGKFSESNVLGVGGFGCVYKAVFDGGVTAAVKRLEGGGPECEKEFENELDLLGRIRHPNIVSLVGFCVHEGNHYIVYELMEKGSLETQLHGPSHGSALSWYIRMKIALDMARGLEYLHEHCSPPVIHRDLKSSNILLDSDFNTKISDFGLAVTSGNLDKGSMKLSGTLGYVAPEYLLDGKLTEKSDVYAFGVVLLELLMGRKPVEKMNQTQCQSIVTWAMPQLTDRSKLPNIVDPVIRDKMDPKHLYQVAAVAVLCVQPEPSYRPLITDVLHSLVPLVPVELGGTLRVAEPPSPNQNHSPRRDAIGQRRSQIHAAEPGLPFIV